MLHDPDTRGIEPQDYVSFRFEVQEKTRVFLILAYDIGNSSEVSSRGFDGYVSDVASDVDNVIEVEFILLYPILLHLERLIVNIGPKRRTEYLTHLFDGLCSWYFGRDGQNQLTSLHSFPIFLYRIASSQQLGLLILKLVFDVNFLGVYQIVLEFRTRLANLIAHY